jgi:hypothetical protein
MPVRVYRATAVYGSWYDGEKARGFEGHFIASLSGKIGANRIKLAKFITPIFRKQIFQEHKIRIPPGQIRIRFEREQLALARSNVVKAEFLKITYRGKERHAERSKPQMFKLSKPHRRIRSKGKTRRKRQKRRSRRNVKRRPIQRPNKRRKR